MLHMWCCEESLNMRTSPVVGGNLSRSFSLLPSGSLFSSVLFWSTCSCLFRYLYADTEFSRWVESHVCGREILWYEDGWRRSDDTKQRGKFMIVFSSFEKTAWPWYWMIRLGTPLHTLWRDSNRLLLRGCRVIWTFLPYNRSMAVVGVQLGRH